MSDSVHPIRVMIVDDHQTMLWGLEQLISADSTRMQVVGTACNGDEAISKALDLKPDVVLLDLDLDGHSALDILPKLLAHPGTQVLILTGERQQQVLDSAVHKGARGVMGKDAAAAQVLKAIEKVHLGELWLDRLTMSRVLSGLMEPQAPQTPHKQDPEAHKVAGLTQRERGIIEIIVQGCGASNKKLAEQLFISEHTLRNHLSSIYHKLDVGNRLELYVYALKHQLAGAEHAQRQLPI